MNFMKKKTNIGDVSSCRYCNRKIVFMLSPVYNYLSPYGEPKQYHKWIHCESATRNCDVKAEPGVA